MLKKTLVAFALLFFGPLLVGSAMQYLKPWPKGWYAADWSSTGALAMPADPGEALVQVYSARAGRWRGLVASHSWIVVKRRGETSYTRYDVVGWGKPVRRNAYAPDGRWYSNAPVLLANLRGAAVDAIAGKVEAAVARYPYSGRGSYTVWPGPNSNTFVAWVLRQVPEIGAELPPTAVGKDFLGPWFGFDRTPTGTGWQVSLGGVAGLALALEEGLELHLFGLTVGLDILDLGIKLPAVGRLSLLGP